jgi:hypothetical protein
MNIASIGIDLGKTTFHLVALDDHGNIVIRKKFSRKQLLVSGEQGTEATATSPVRELRKQVRNLKRVLAEKTWKWVFSKMPCKKSRLDATAAAALAGRHLRVLRPN